MLHQFRREDRPPKSGQRQPLRSRPSRGFRSVWHGAIVLRGWALAEQGQGEEGIAQIRQGLAAYRAKGAELYGRIILPCWPRRMGK